MRKGPTSIAETQRRGENGPVKISFVKTTVFKTWPVPLRLCVSALAVGFLLVGCGQREKYEEPKLPLPPISDTGVEGETFYQVEYGFAFPAPAKWLFMRIVGDQEADEVARFTDKARESYLRVFVSHADPSGTFSPKDWFAAREKGWAERDYKVKKREDGRDLPAGGKGAWSSSLFHLTDPQRADWTAREWVLPKDDLILGARISMPTRVAGKPEGKALLDGAEASLSKITWLTPIGPRGLSLERYELKHFSERFCRALESGSLVKTSVFFDEMYPARGRWAKWYEEAAGAKPAQNSLRAELAGLVINGDLATASFALMRTVPGAKEPGKSLCKFGLSKKEGSWRIVAPIEK
jgi:hypothetical protein